MDQDLNARPETLKLLQENVWKTLQILGTGSEFLNSIPIA
jgi:hypothetical protein